MKANMKRMIMITALCMIARASVSGETAEVASGILPFDSMMFYPDGTLTFNGGDAALTNLPGFYERSGASVGNWAGNLAQPLTFNGLKPAAEMLDLPLISSFPTYTQYSYTGMWHVPAAGDYSFAGTFDDGVYLEIDGQPILSTQSSGGRAFTNGVPMSQGWHTLHARCMNIGGNGGRPADWASGAIFSPDNLDLSDAANIGHGQAFGAGNDVVATLDAPSRIYGRMIMNQNGTLAVSQHPAIANDPVFSGTVQSPAGETLTFTGLNGSRLLFGSLSPSAPAVLDGNVANALTLTNHAWLCRLPGDYTVAQGATLAFDGIANPDVSGGSLTLATYSLQMLATTPGISAVTVNGGTTLSFDSRTYADGIFTDGPAAFSTDITLGGGSVLFNAAQPMLFDGTFAGTGDIAKNGTNTLTLAGNGTGCAATFTLNDGTAALSNAAALCGAPVFLDGGRLSNLTGMTLANPVTAQAGGFETPAGTTLELTGAVTGIGTGGISKWGGGTLRLSGSADNTGLTLHALDGATELNKSSGYAVRNIGDIRAGASVTLTGATGGQIADDGRVRLSGGTFDLNGHDETVGYIATSSYGSTIINNGPQTATFTLAAADNAAAIYEHGVLADGTFPLSVVKTGTGTQTVKADALQHSGATTVSGGTLRLLAAGHNSASLFRLTFKAARPIPAGQNTSAPNYYGTGIQFSEFQLTYKGEGLPWPSQGMIAEGAGGSGNEVSSRVVDNSTSTKWYFNQTIPLPNRLIVTSPAPVAFDGYRLATAGDAFGRDPATWTLDIGTVDGGTTNWVQIDERSNYDMPTARNTYSPILSVQPLLAPLDAGPIPLSESPLLVDAAGTVMLSNFAWEQPLGGLAGSGMLALDNARVSLTNPESFTGSVIGNGTLALAGTAGEIATAAPLGVGITLINNGAPATLLNTSSGTNFWGGSIQDGAAPLGLKQTSGTNYYAGQNSTYSGDTVISGGEAIIAGGEAIIAGIMPVRYIRVTPLLMKPGKPNYTVNHYQLSRFDLMAAGQILPYPEGTTAYGEAYNRTGNQGTHEILTGSTSTKYYSEYSASVNPFVIVLPHDILADGYTWFTAGDAEGRDPTTWTVEISTDGHTWTQVDNRQNEPVTSARNAQVGAWPFTTILDTFCALSPNSRTTVGSGARLSIIDATEPIGPLSGNGAIALTSGTLALSTFADAAFAGGISGDGTVVKSGPATQTLSGALTFSGTLIVKAGTLDLTGARLTGVTNIIVKAGAELTGAAKVNGNLTVTFETGGMYSGSLAVTGALTIEGEVTLAVPSGAAYPYTGTLFTYASADATTQRALLDAIRPTAVPTNMGVTIKVDNTKATLTIAPTGTLLILQ